jgi:hypothetical protein
MCSLFMSVYVLAEEIVLCPGYEDIVRPLRCGAPCDPNMQLSFLVAREAPRMRNNYLCHDCALYVVQ